jgi:hypothetical protein
VILAAGLLILLGIGLFVAGILTGATWLYFACIAACVVAAVLLFLARRQMTAMTGAKSRATEPATTTSTAPPVTAEPASGGGSAVSALSADGVPADGVPAGGAPVNGAPMDEATPVSDLDDPPVEEVEVTDLLLVVDVTDEVLVIDEHPRYHLAGCRYLAGRTPIPLPLDEAKSDGFTPCAACEPDRNLAERVRAQRSTGNR